MQYHIYLRPVELADAPLLTKWFNDKNNVKYMSTILRYRTHTIETVRESIMNYDPSYERLFMVCSQDDGRAIGHAGIDDIDFYDKRGEIFFLIGEKSARGKGYGNELVQLLVDYGFKNLKLESMFATATVKNIRAIRAIEHAGFKKIGIRRRYHYLDGTYYDEILFDITRNDYYERKR